MRTDITITDDLMREMGRTKSRIEDAIKQAEKAGDENLLRGLLERKAQVEQAEDAFKAQRFPKPTETGCDLGALFRKPLSEASPEGA